MALRLLVRAAPFVLGAVAVAIWLRRRQAERTALPAAEPAAPAPAAAEAPAAALPAAEAPAAALPAAEAPAQAEPPAAEPPAAPERRFERRRVDIVTVVDDLLGATR
jgi:hypothetical protein